MKPKKPSVNERTVNIFNPQPIKLWYSRNFTEWILPHLQNLKVKNVKVKKFVLPKPMTDEEILEKVGKPFTVQEFGSALQSLLLKQPEGQDGTLLSDGYANIFYVKLDDGRVVTVRVLWSSDDRKWHCHAYVLDDHDQWLVGHSVFSRS